ncbi:oligogalacturonate-specific porin KdgM family protein [Desulforhopalus sp. 52FAK]
MKLQISLMGKWLPYIEVWNIKGSDASTDRRQMKYRAGIKYRF